ncbi:MAG TPA: tyrosine-type recombinase/integrase [Bacteroidia bacterium]|nr:tyrosine-type recombinase/integrase [Bacteroidia bacterium]
MKNIDLLIVDFLSHCMYEKNLSAKTLKAYTIDLRQFTEFLDKSSYSHEISTIDKFVLREYLRMLSTSKPRTIKRKIATVKALFNFLEFEDIITVNPFRKIKVQLKEINELPKGLTLFEVKEIFDVVYGALRKAEKFDNYLYLEKLRDAAVIELLFATGARVFEMSNLKEKNVDLQIGNIKLFGKGRKERIIQICNTETKRILKEYHARFKDRIEKSGGYFFVNKLNKPLSEQSIRFLVKRSTLKAGIRKHVTPHAFRHSFATLLLEREVDIKYIQHFLGHSSITTTQIYTRVNGEKQREILSKKHPRKFFKIAQHSAPA